MGNKLFVSILVLIVVGLGFFALTKNNPQDSQPQSSGSEHVEGTGSLEVVEYGDFECPSCASYFPLVNQIKQELGDKIVFRFRHFPLIQIHANAMAAHRAAEAAGNQGKFTEMHDLLFQRRESWIANSGVNVTQAIAVFQQFATELGLDMDQYNIDANGPEVSDVINADIALGRAAGATGTPTFVINGKVVPLEEIRDFESFKNKINQEIEANMQGTSN